MTAAQKSPSVTSKNLTISIDGSDGIILPISITCDGGGSTPTFTWNGLPEGTKSLAITLETVPGPPRPGDPVAAGNHFYYVGYNINPIDSNSNKATLGKNFQNRIGYTPPCSQGPGVKTYTATLFAMSKVIDHGADIDGNTLQKVASENLIAKASKSFIYARS